MTNSPLSYSIDPAARVVNVRYKGDPTSAQWSAMMAAILKDAVYQSGFGILLDRRAVSTPPTTDYIKRCVRFIGQNREVMGGGRWAVVSSDLGTFGMGRMAEQLLDCDECLRAFREHGEAMAWLRGDKLN